MLKILGAALLVLCGGVLGFGGLKKLREELAFLRAMDGALGIMAAEIELCARPLPDLFALLGERGVERTRGFFLLAYAKSGDMSAGEAWAECCRQPSLPKSAREALAPLSAVLGAYDAERQCGEIALARRALASEAARFEQKLGSRGQSWPALGACLAGVAAMLMI